MLWLPKWLKTDENPQGQPKESVCLSRRAFSFGLVGAVVTLAAPPLLLPARDILPPSLLWDGARDLSLFGVAYHQNDWSTGSWIGLDRYAGDEGALEIVSREIERVRPQLLEISRMESRRVRQALSSLKTIKRKLQAPGSYREALIELGKLRSLLEVLHLRNGDTILFKLEERERMTNEMIRTFLDVASERGLKDINALLLKAGDSVEALTDEAFDQLARMKGYIREDEHASSVEGSAASDGDRRTSSGGSKPGEQGAAEDEQVTAARLCEHEGEGAPQAEGLRPEEERLFSDEEVKQVLDRPEFWKAFVTPVIERGGKYEVTDGIRQFQTEAEGR
jgi:hypothetical protein